jgi:hypothetical protein
MRAGHGKTRFYRSPKLDATHVSGKIICARARRIA